MSSNYLFLLFLLLVVLFPVLLLLTRVRARTFHPAARAADESRALDRASSLFQAPGGSHEGVPPTTMSETPTPRRNENDRWKAFIQESEAAVEQYLVPGIDMDLASFIRCITFRVFSAVFLDTDPNTLTFPKLQLVTAGLTDFYDDGEGKGTLAPEVQSILYEWLPRERFPTSLDRILPAYEALWRIVATLVVTCEDDETRSLRWVMLDFRDNPRDRQYKAYFGDGEKSVSAITDGVVGRITPIARPPDATTSTWPLSCIQYAFAKGPLAVCPPTRQEALKFAALLASMVIGQIGVHYRISGEVLVMGSQGSPWEQRKVFGINRGTITPEIRPHTSSSKQDH